MFSLKSIAFIDAAVEDYSLLIAGLAPGVRPHLIRPGVDGIREISRVLRSQFTSAMPIQSIHIVAHGSPGSLKLGQAELNLDTLGQYALELGSWSVDSILLYGCQVAAGDAGEELIRKLNCVTGAAIAASTTLIGAAEKGGNWELDATVGTVLSEAPDSKLAFDQAVLASYSGSLNSSPVAPDDPDSETFNLVELSFFELFTVDAGGNQTVETGSVNISEGESVFFRGRVVNDGTPDDDTDGEVIDVRVTVADRVGQDTGDGIIQLSGDDILFNFAGNAGREGSLTVLQFDFFEENTLTPNPISTSFTVEDLDSSADGTTSGRVFVNRLEASTFGLNDPTRLLSETIDRNPPVSETDTVSDLLRDLDSSVLVAPAGLTAFESQEFNGSGTPAERAPEFALQVNFQSIASLEIGLVSEFNSSGFFFDTDRDFNFSNLITVGADGATTDEDSIVTVSAATGLLDNDFDPDGDPLSVSEIRATLADAGVAVTDLVSGMTLTREGGIVTVNADGSYTYDPNGQFDDLEDGETATDSFVYTVSDGRGGTDQATVTITITGVSNEPPIVDLNGAADGVNRVITTEGTAINIADSLAEATDPDGAEVETLTITVGGVLDGDSETLTIAGTPIELGSDATETVSGLTITVTDSGQTITIENSNGSPFSQIAIDELLRNIQYQNGASTPQPGNRTFTFVASDAASDGPSAVSTVSVSGSLTDDEATTTEGTPTAPINVQANDSLTGTVEIETPPPSTVGSAIVNADNNIVFTPADFFSGEVTLDYRVGSETATVTIAVDPVAEAPTVTASDAVGVEGQNIALNLSAGALADTDGSETVAFLITDVPSGFELRTTDGTTLTRNSDENFVVTSAQLSDLQLVPPDDFFTTNSPLNLSLTATSTDTATIDGQQETDTDTTSDSFTVTVQEDSDGDGTPNVDEPPVVDLNGADDGVGFGSTFAAGGDPVAIADTDATATDPTGDDIETFTLSISGLTDAAGEEQLFIGTTPINLDANGSFTLTIPDTTTGLNVSVSVTDSENVTLTFTRSAGGDFTQAEADALLRSLNYQSTATQPEPGPRTFSFAANDGSNDSLISAVSTIQVLGDLTNDEATTTEGTPTDPINVQANDSLTGTVQIETAPPSIVGSAIVNADNNIVFTPADFFSGEATLDYRVGSETATVTIAVAPVAEAPTVTGADVTGVEGQNIALNLNAGALADTDGSETVTFSLTGVPTVAGADDFELTTAGGATITRNPDGSFTLSSDQLPGLQLVPPDDFFTGTTPLELTLTATSTDTAMIGGAEVSDTNTSSVSFDVAVQEDSDGDGTPNVDEPPVVDLNGADDGVGFGATFAAGGDPVAIADTDATATDPTGDDIETLVITISGLADGDAEQLIIDSATINLNSNGSSTVALPGLTSYNVQVSGAGDGSTTVAFSRTGGGDFSQAEIDGLLRAINYQNTASQPDLGNRTFQVTANDGTQSSAIATSIVQISAELQDDAIAINEGETAAINVSGNDQIAGDITIQTVPDNGSVVSTEDGTITYQPNPGFSGVDRLIYEVGGETAELVITVNPVAEAPESTAADVFGLQDEAIAFNVTPGTLNDTDGSETLTFTITGVPQGEGFSFTDANGMPVGMLQPDGSFVFTPEELTGLQLQPPAGFTGDLDLTLVSTAVDEEDLTGDGDTSDPNESVTDVSSPTQFTVSFLSDTDGDGVADVDDLDDDNDGILDSAELGDDPTRDTDGDGIIDSLDLDSDGDGITDLRESGLSAEAVQQLDSEGDGRIDIDPDNDNFGDNGFADAVETFPESGQADYDGDSVSDDPADTDGDGVPDFQDLDSDNDGINDVIEAAGPNRGEVDQDGDGRIDGFDDDEDRDGLANIVDSTVGGSLVAGNPLEIPDSDDDGAEDFRDLDSDNDGVPDLIEGGGIQSEIDLNNDGVVDGPDEDGDGIQDPADATPNAFGDGNGPTAEALPDTDGTGLPNFRTPNSEGPGGTPDRILAGLPSGEGTPDSDGDGVIDGPITDTDGDGIADAVDTRPGEFSGIESTVDTDGDGVADVDDLDDDNDGIPDLEELRGNPTRDTDGDGIIDSLDLDSDSDGIPDLRESGLSFLEIQELDSDGDGRIDLNTASGERRNFGDNGFADAVETEPESGLADFDNDGQVDPPADTDEDGVPDFQDLDSDNDGLNDVIEAGGDDVDGNGQIDGETTDLDGDGLADIVDPTVEGGTSGTALPVPDTDGDGLEDFRDLDSDGDNIPDIVEGGVVTEIADLVNPLGRLDGPDTDGDGIPDSVDGAPGGFGDQNDPGRDGLPDSNGDGTPDVLDPNPPAVVNPPQTGGSNEITGTEGADVLNGLSDMDVLDGGGGDDVVIGGSETDRVIGGDGDDRLAGGTGDDDISAGNGNDLASGGSGNDVVRGDAGNDILSGGSGNDLLEGGGDRDVLIGGTGNDSLLGQADVDTLQAGRGDDLLVGGAGADFLRGGQGIDTFRYESVSDFGDTIQDFEILFDRIDLSPIFGGNGSFGATVQATQQGRDTLVQVQIGGGLQSVATLQDVNAFTLGDRHFLF